VNVADVKVTAALSASIFSTVTFPFCEHPRRYHL
jgi:hypothetical protein